MHTLCFAGISLVNDDRLQKMQQRFSHIELIVGMIKQEQFENSYRAIENQRTASSDLNKSLRTELEQMMSAFLAYLDTVEDKNKKFQEYMDIQKEMMFGRGDPLPFANLFPGINVPNRTLDQEGIEKMKRLRQLAFEIQSDIKTADMQVSSAGEMISTCQKGLARYKAQQEMILDSEKMLLEDLDSPWDFVSQIGTTR